MKKLATLLLFSLFASTVYSQTINTFPYLEDFESEPNCSSICGTPCALTGQWFNVLSDSIDWIADSDGTSSTPTGPTANGGADHTTGAAGGKYLYVETSCATGSPNKVAIVESPWFDFTAENSMVFSFWYHAYGATMGNLTVETRTGMGASWTSIAGPITDDLDLWQEFSTCLGAGYGGEDSVQVRFYYVSGSSFTGDMAIDDISLRPLDLVDVGVTDVIAPSGCGLSNAETIQIEVTNFGDSTLQTGHQIPVSYRVDGGTIISETMTLSGTMNDGCTGGGTAMYTFTTTADLSTPGAHLVEAWTAHVMDVSPGNDSSSVIANHVPPGGALPYFEDFESGQGGWVIDNGANGSWAFGTPAAPIINSAASGINAFMVGGLTGGYQQNESGYVTSPCIDISAATGGEVVVLSIWYECESNWDGANLWSSYDEGATWNLVGAFNDPNNWYNDNGINSAPGGDQQGWSGDGIDGSGAWLCAQSKLDSLMLINNSRLMLRIHFSSDGSVQEEGFAFDNVAVGIPTTANVLPDTAHVCDTLYVIDAGSGFSSYFWSTGETGQTITVTATGDYSVTVVDSLGMCAEDQIHVNLQNFILPGLADITVCQGDSALFDAQGGTNITYSWSTGDNTQTSWLTSPGPISVTKTDNNTGCTATDSANLFYNVPVALMDSSICTGTSITLDGSIANGQYVWSTGETTATITIDSAGTYFLDATDSILGCTSVDTMVLSLWANPTPMLGADSTWCDSVVLDAGTGMTSYVWSSGGSGQMETIFTSGLIDVMATDSNGCIGADTIDVTINNGPVVDLGGDIMICVNHTTTLDAGPGTAYLWGGGETTQTVVVDGTVLGVGSFPYSVDVTGSNGCIGSDMITVTVDSCLSVDELANRFTIRVYPNPTAGELTIAVHDLQRKPIQLNITDLQGRTVVAEQYTNNSTDYTVSLELGRLAKGTYLLRLDNGGLVQVQRIQVR